VVEFCIVSTSVTNSRDIGLYTLTGSKSIYEHVYLTAQWGVGQTPCSLEHYLASKIFKMAELLHIHWKCITLNFKLLNFVFRPPAKSTWWPEAMFKILYRSDLYFRNYCDFNFQKFGLKRLFGGQKKVWGFCPETFGIMIDTPKDFLARTRAFWRIDRQNRSTVATCRRREETKKQKEKSQTVILRMCSAHPRRPIAPIFGS